MKTLHDVKIDMSDLYDQVKGGHIDVKVAAELANITGKYLKAAQLEMAKEFFERTHNNSLERTEAQARISEK